MRAEDQGESGDDAGEAAGVGEHGPQATGGFVTRRRPRRRLTIPRAADAQVIRRGGRTARRAPATLTRVRLEPRPDHRHRDRAPDRACSACSRRSARDNTGRWLTAALVNGAAVAFRRRSPLPALTAVVIAQALAHDETYDTDPLSPFLAELILLFTVAYELRFRPALAGLGIGLAYVAIDFGSGRIERITQAGRAVRLLPARVGRSAASSTAHETRARRPSIGPSTRRAPRSPTSARGSRASCTTRSRTACP